MTITSKSNKADVFAAYQEAQTNLDNMLSLIREATEENSLNICEDGLEKFCKEAGISYTAPVTDAIFVTYVRLMVSGVTLDEHEHVAEEDRQRITKMTLDILSDAGMKVQEVFHEDSWPENVF